MGVKVIRLFLLTFLSNMALASPPSFEDYPSSHTQALETLEHVDLSSHPDAPYFKTRLTYLIGESANFAGHYVLTSWGCGSSCQQVATVDVNDGKVYFLTDSSNGVCASPYSDLLVENPIPAAFLEDGEESLPSWLETRYYQWSKGELTLLYSSGEATNHLPLSDCDL